MNGQILVSIVVPVYNMGTKIECGVESLIKQTYQNIEIILVDDGSKDDSLVVCNKIAEKDNRVKVFHTENQGSGPARNYGISQAKGKYIYFPDADDILAGNAIEILVNSAEKSGVDLVVFGYRSMAPSGKVISRKKYVNTIVDGSVVRSNYLEYYGSYMPFSIQGAPWNKFFKRQVIEKNKVEYPPLRRHQDEAFIARYLTYCDKIQFIDNVFYTYYVNDIALQWDKYPINYIDAVIGLYKDRQNNMLTWNSDDSETHAGVYREFICNAIKALELSFSPKHGFDYTMRLNWIKNKIEDSGIRNIDIPRGLGWYQTIVLKLITTKCYKLLYAVLKFKVYAYDKHK